MALRPVGVYLLAGTALKSQSRCSFHLSEMESLASRSASLSLLADSELAASAELELKSASDSEEGLVLSGESAELETKSEAEFAKAAAETLAGDELIEEAETLREKSAEDALESEASFARSAELRSEAEELKAQAGRDRAAAALDEERSTGSFAKSAEAEELATGAEEAAAEYEALALRREAQAGRDGEALLETEAGAAEDAEVMAACAPIPFVDLFCEAVGAVIESGYQGVAAFEGAKAAVESLSAVVLHRKERAELAIAVEEQGEAARLAAEGERLQVLAEEEGERAVVEDAESDAASVAAGEARLAGEEEAAASEEEGALAALDEEKAAEEYVEAARDEAMALEDESAAVAAELESEELMSESAAEEMESLAERSDGEAKEAEAGRMLERSVGHGLNAFGFLLHAIVTAGLVAYVVVMRGLTKVVAQGVAGALSGQSRPRTIDVLDNACGYILHVGIVIGTVATMRGMLSNLEEATTPGRVRAFFLSSTMAAVVESLGIHAMHRACCCHAKGMDRWSIIASAVASFSASVVRLIPVVLMEMLIVTVILGPGVFEDPFFSGLNPTITWAVLIPLALIFVSAIKLRTSSDEEISPKRPSTEVREHESLCSSNGRPSQSHNDRDVDREYGTMEEVSLLSSKGSSHDDSECSHRPMQNSSSSKSLHTASTSLLERCRKACHRYCEGLRMWSDLLALSLMAMLLWHYLPVLRVLRPLAKESLGAMSSLVSVPVAIIALATFAVLVHFIFVQ